MIRQCVYLCLVGLAAASYCGESAIPYSLEVLPTGQPVLGCGRPKCFGWHPTGKPLINNANFFRINQHPDGFLRDDPTLIPAYDRNDLRMYSRQQAVCEQVPQSTSCASEDQWVGGISPLLNVTSLAAYQCCTYEPLRHSSDQGIATVAGGQIVVGGEVLDNGNLYAFDYISDIEKTFDENNAAVYQVNIRRFSCLDLNNVNLSNEKVANADNLIRESNALESRRAVVHQAPNVEVGPNEQIPLENANNVNANTEEGEQVFVEEIVAQQAIVQQPPPPPPQPAAPFQPVQPVQFAQAPPPVQYQPVATGYWSPQLYYCFSGDSLVSTTEGENIRMDELQVGDWIMTNTHEGIRSFKVEYWMHRNPEQVAEFMKVETNAGSILKLTETHLIYKTTCGDSNVVYANEVNEEPVSAKNLNTGDCLYQRFNNEIIKTKVTKITRVTEKGIYSPMIAPGTLLVNDIYTSCLSAVSNQNMQYSFFTYMNEVHQIIKSYFGNMEQPSQLGLTTLVDMMDLLLPGQLYSF